MKPTKVAIIGAGSVGATAAYALMLHNIVTEIILIDIDKDRCRGEVLDLSDVLGFSATSRIHSGTATDAQQADIIIIAAGSRQKPGQSRIELITTNRKVLSSIIAQIQPLQQDAIVVIVTNPLDVLTLCAQKELNLPRAQVFGTGTFLDSQRLQVIIAERVGVAPESVHAYILGEHGDTQFPVWSTAHIDGTPLHKFKQLSSPAQLNAIAQETRDRAYEIIACKGATFFGIATCVSAICRSIIFDEKKIMPLSVFHENLGICLSVPAILGKKGIERVLEVPLNQAEQEKLATSIAALQKIQV